MIDKLNSPGERRPLTVLSGDNKIISTAIEIVLSVIYEGVSVEFVRDESNGEKHTLHSDTIFRNSSHGFRPKRGVHTALNTVRT